MAKRIRCPYCYEEVKTTELKFYCKNCKQFVNYNPSFFEKCGLKTKTHILCPKCNQRTSVKRCPHCNEELPFSIDSIPNMSIAIVGAQDSGKSHYIAMLIKQLGELGGAFTLRALNDETVNRYERDFYNPLFNRREIINKTQSGKARHDLTHPLIYSLHCKWKNKSILLKFFDTAGEDLESGVTRMESLNRYICSASGIICLLDPLQLENVRSALSNCISKNDLPIKNLGTEQIVKNVTELISNDSYNTGRNFSGLIDIPLAIAISKTDALVSDTSYPLLFDSQSPLFQDGLCKGAFSLGDFTRINSLMHDWVALADNNTISEAERYQSVGFFGFSALGNQTQFNGNARVLTCTPRPCRVLDPFIWILWKNGLIPAIK